MKVAKKGTVQAPPPMTGNKPVGMTSEAKFGRMGKGAPALNTRATAKKR